MNYQSKWIKGWGWTIYSVWHVIFVMVALFIILPHIVLPMINYAFIGATPLHYTVYAILIFILPFASIAVVWSRFREDTLTVLKLFFAVEIPLIFLLLLRIILFRQMHLDAQLLLLQFSIAIGGYSGFLFYKKRPSTIAGRYLESGISTLIALVGIYLGVLLGIYYLPHGLLLPYHIWNFLGEMGTSILNPLLFIVLLLFGITALLFILTPIVLITAYVKQYIQRIQETPKLRIITVALGILLMEAGIFTFAGEQKQQAAFEMTQTIPSDSEQMRQLLGKEDTIRKGLLNAYLAAHRYVSTTGTSQSVKKNYAGVFGKSSVIADFAQHMFNYVASPFLYEGDDFKRDKILASERYQYFFDTPIEKRERESILSAIKATWEREGNEAGLMNAASRYVFLKDQSIKIKDEGDLAAITITQVFVNQTYRPQEVVLHFQLPEDAVVTGLWMSDDISNPEKFPHVVSPRGAAQSVYKAEVNRSIDPALLEKVGPMQYRLRAFPIPERLIDDKRAGGRIRSSFKGYTVNPASVQFEYVVSMDKKGAWPLPLLLEKRNAYWNEKTTRSHPVPGPQDWMPQSLKTFKKIVLTPHTAIFENHTIQAVPRDTRKPDNELKGPIAVIVDGSYSMNQVQTPLKKQLHWLEKTGVTFDLFFCRNRCEKIDIDVLKKRVFFGNSQILQHLQEWEKIRDRDYTSLYVLSDEGSYELSPGKKSPLQTPAQPMWLIHLGEHLPYAYDDGVIDAVNERGGGIAKTLSEAIENFLWSRQIGQTLEEKALIGTSSNYFWYLKNESQRLPQSSDLFTAMAAGHFITHLSTKKTDNRLEQLDLTHGMAKKYDIVSYFSSMLVLVEDRQREILKAAEKQSDRFDREIETGEKVVSSPTDALSVPAIPEPEEWGLLMIVLLFLIIAYVRKTKTSRDMFFSSPPRNDGAA